jgi:hypothetical protein
MTEEYFKLEKEMLIEGQENLEKEKQALADKIIDLTKQYEELKKELEEKEEQISEFVDNINLLKQRLPRFANIIDKALIKDEEKE